MGISARLQAPIGDILPWVDSTNPTPLSDVRRLAVRNKITILIPRRLTFDTSILCSNRDTPASTPIVEEWDLASQSTGENRLWVS